MWSQRQRLEWLIYKAGSTKDCRQNQKVEEARKPIPWRCHTGHVSCHLHFRLLAHSVGVLCYGGPHTNTRGSILHLAASFPPYCILQGFIMPQISVSQAQLPWFSTRDTLSEVPSLRSNLIRLYLDNCPSPLLVPILPHSPPFFRQKSKQGLKNIKPSYYSSTQKLPLVFHQTSNKIQIPYYGPQNPPSPALSASQSSSDPMLSLSFHAPGPFSSSSKQPHMCPLSLTPAPPHWTLEYIPLWLSLGYSHHLDVIQKSHPLGSLHWLMWHINPNTITHFTVLTALSTFKV